jgi:hypothetical protein
LNRILNSINVGKIFWHCLYRQGEPETTRLTATGVFRSVNFSTIRIGEKHADIEKMLCELPNDFVDKLSGGGGGWAFQFMGGDKNYNEWTVSKEAMERLLLLGIATGGASCFMPKMKSRYLHDGNIMHVVVYKKVKLIEETAEESLIEEFAV